MRITKPHNFVIFGGGRLLVEFSRVLERKGYCTYIFAAPRHLNETIDSNGITLRQTLKKTGLAFFEEEDINRSEALKKITQKASIGIGLGEVYTFNKNTIRLFSGMLFDFMTIKLPKFRGGAHITWQILMGDRKGAWNIQLINKEMVPGVFDSGEIIKTRNFSIPEKAVKPCDFIEIYNTEAVALLSEFMDEIENGKNFTPRKLNEEESSYYPRLFTLIHGFIDWAWSLDEIIRFINAFSDPYPGASTFVNGKRIFIKSATVSQDEGTFHPFMDGLIYRVSGSSVFIAHRDGSLVAKEILDEKGRIHLPRPGNRLHTPVEHLENALSFNAEYDAKGLKK